MIKINLLGVPPPPPKTVARAPASHFRQVVVFAATMAVSFAMVGLFYLIWSGGIEKLSKELKKQKADQARLAAIKAENIKYEQQRRLLEQRINTIESLQTSRVGPTEFMNALADVVNQTNRDLYLFSVTPQGERLAMRGQAASPESVANLLHSLKTSGHFDDVQLKQFYEDDQENRLSYKFNLDCTYKSSIAAVSSSPAGAANPARLPGT